MWQQAWHLVLHNWQRISIERDESLGEEKEGRFYIWSNELRFTWGKVSILNQNEKFLQFLAYLLFVQRKKEINKIEKKIYFKKCKWCANANMAVGYWTSNIVRQRKTKIVKYLSSLKTKAVTQNKITKKILVPWLLFHWPILSVTFENRVFFQCQSGEKCGKRLGENENLSFWHLACQETQPGLASLSTGILLMMFLCLINIWLPGRRISKIKWYLRDGCWSRTLVQDYTTDYTAGLN